VAALLKDGDNVGSHAAGEGKGGKLHWRWPGGTVAVDDNGVRPARRGKA
jgi:hypothetical protein